MRPWRYVGANPDGWWCKPGGCNGVANGTVFVDRELKLIAKLHVPLLRLEFPRPLIEPTPDEAPLRDWKARAVRRTFADWPGAIAWVEDGFLPEAHSWAAERLALRRRTWLVDVSETGLTEEITQYLLEWST